VEDQLIRCLIFWDFFDFLILRVTLDLQKFVKTWGESHRTLLCNQ